jgi:hypothetical protein
MNQRELREYMTNAGAIAFIRALNDFIPEQPLDPHKDRDVQLIEAGRRSLVLQLNRMLEER